MSVIANATYYPRAGGGDDIQPTFTGYGNGYTAHSEFADVARAVRQAFAFFRRHGDRRYSAASLMRLLAFADRIDQGHVEDIPCIVTCEVPFSYDEDTEVKSGGIVGIAILLPDNRMMLAVHSERRRKRVGTALLRFVGDYFTSYPVVWAHRANTTAAGFLASQELMPWAINTAGAVQFCTRQPFPEESEAVQEEPDYVVDEMLSQQRRNTRNRPSVRMPDAIQPTTTLEEQLRRRGPLRERWPEMVAVPDAVMADDEWEFGEDISVRPMPTCGVSGCIEEACRPGSLEESRH